MWKVELCRKVEIEHLAEDMSKPSVDGAARFLLAAFRKMWKKRDKKREEVFNQNELGLPSGKHSPHSMTSKDGPEAGAQSRRGLFPGFET